MAWHRTPPGVWNTPQPLHVRHSHTLVTPAFAAASAPLMTVIMVVMTGAGGPQPLSSGSVAQYLAPAGVAGCYMSAQLHVSVLESEPFDRMSSAPKGCCIDVRLGGTLDRDLNLQTV